MKAISKRDLAVVQECLALGIPLEFRERGSVRKFTAGQITSDILRRNWVRTTHLMPNPRDGRVCLNGEAVAELADQARDKLTRKDELLAAQAAARDAFYAR